MAPKTLTPSAPLIQGISSPQVVVDPNPAGAFYAATRRLKYAMRSLTNISGLGTTDSVPLRQTGIVAGLEVRVTGNVVFGGTITGTSMLYEWPFNLVKEFRLSANGQSQLVVARGLTVRALEFVMNPKLDDSGISKTFNGATANAGTLALPSDDWGTSAGNSLSPNSTVAATGTYTVDLTYFIPVCSDYVSLIGSIYAQSAATNLTLDIQWNTQAALLTLGGSATFAQNLQYSVVGQVFSIPNVGGNFVVPDLSQFHQISEIRFPGLAQNLNQPVLPGVGVGRKLLRLLGNVYTGATPAPLAMNAANFNGIGWAYGGSDVPEFYDNGTSMRALAIRVAGTDIGGLWGFLLWDFASIFALRDVVDEGATSDLRVQVGLVASPTAGVLQLAQETLFAAPVGA
jgi:hypothetical protein